MSGGWNPLEHCDGSGVTRHVDSCPCPEHSDEREDEFDEWENAGRYYPNTLYPTLRKADRG